jgi:hypothetical protein
MRFLAKSHRANSIVPPQDGISPVAVAGWAVKIIEAGEKNRRKANRKLRSDRSTPGSDIPIFVHFFYVSFNPGEQFGNGDAKASRDGHGCLNGEIVLSALDAAHIRSVESAVVRKRLLRKPFLQPQFTDPLSEDLL